MDYYKHKAVDEGLPQLQQPQAPPPPPPMSHFSTPTYFTQQAIRAGYVEPPQFENKLDHIHHQPVNMREAIMREIEKESIREKIIAEEIARRRMPEFDVRRELMMERQLTKQIGEGFSPLSSPTLPFLKQQSDVTSVEERTARSQMGRGIQVSRLGARNEIGRLDIMPFEERISEMSFHQRSLFD
ncbi:uncharacterized protein LOC129891553 [Solanum dulcamara]|uniref:uncharacterized protein LOC129891553 n=1 Tax=Solanum dulcamara TaxID=45834 RepID=UPI002485BBA3|nr:uncharacterized protein LOC129891553 [Solanum dulcamara]